MGSERSAAKLERFDTTERLGEGASGVVYRALDRVRGEVVALKVLSVSDPDSLFRFKGEFRALASLKHRNLLELYELVTHNEQWLLTMELVKGRDFLNFVRPGGEKPATQQQGDDLTEVVDVEAWTNPALADGAIGDAQPENDVLAYPADAVHRGTLDPRRLRSALQQLFEGLKALHASNRIHRDLKPANVLLFDADERLVICDFGLVTTRPIERMASRLGDQFSAGAGSTTNGEIAGTLAFMSPEQATGHAIAPASDYYAVGVMLYQALTGQVPFDPRLPRQVAIRAKSEQRPRHPRAINADAPEDLSDLALALLDPDPAQRPGYSDVMRVAREGADALAWPSNRPAAPEVLIGRHEQIGQLAAALQQARSGLATVALLSGRSGMGKSAVAQAFLNSAIEQENVLVLAGRCYEREQLPHKALDPLIDSLSDHLLSMDEQTVRDLVPPTTSSLARLFPALLRVSYVKELCGAGNEPIDPASKKRRAYASLREILRRLSLRRPLILFIDDLQWGDVESGPWFTELLHPPQPPSLLLLCAYRAEDEERSPLLTALRKTHLPEAGIQTPVVVKVAELDATESNELALACLSGIPDLEKAAALVAREGGGSPFFLRMFADYVRRHGTEAAAKVKLEDLLSKQIEALAPAARQLLSIVATAGRPEMLRVVYDAAQLHAGGQSALRALEAQRLVQTTGVDADDRVEVCHDRIRETAYRLLDANSKAGFHRELARTLERHQPEGAEGLLNHWRAAGERTKAGDYALKAAQKAENSLAFGRAAELLSEALALLAPEPVQARQLEERRGRALVLAGRGVEAADAFFRAMEGAQEDHAMQLRAMATTQLLRAGRLAQAFAELGRARKMLGLAFPKSDLRAVGMLLWRRAQIWLRGLRLRVRRNAKATQLHRIDMQWAIASSLSCMDHLRGSIYQAEHMLTALRSGDPYRMACALGMESTVLSSENKNPARTQRVIDRGLELAGISGESHALSVVKGTAGVSRMLEGRFREAVRLTRESQEILRDRLNATLAWDNVTMVFFDLQSTAMLGNVQELIQRVPEVLRDAEERGDIYAATCCRTFRCSWAWLGPDQPQVAREQVAIAERQWSQDGYHLQHYYTTQALADIALYEGNVEEVWQRIRREWPPSFFVRQIQHARTEITNMRARVALGLAVQTRSTEFVKQAAADARGLVREGMPWTLALGRLLEACALSFERPEVCAQLLKEVEGQFEALDMKLHAMVVSYRRGQLLGAAEGEAKLKEARSGMSALGVRNPEAFVRMLAPGFPAHRL
jgi:serine/threonine protein kinase